VTQIKTVETDGYNAVQLGYGQGKNLSKSVSGHVKAAGVTPKVLKEFRVETLPELKIGDKISVESFKLGDKVEVTGISKGKGYAGTVKRWNFNESRNTHGFKGNIRRVGSIGSMYPQKENARPHGPRSGNCQEFGSCFFGYREQSDWSQGRRPRSKEGYRHH
jgi:large subunit ribosomal protein L3